MCEKGAEARTVKDAEEQARVDEGPDAPCRWVQRLKSKAWQDQILEKDKALESCVIKLSLCTFWMLI